MTGGTRPEKTLRVVHVLRDDHETHVGGDLVQLSETVRALREHGVDAFPATLTDAPWDVDVVHLYNVMLSRQLVDAYRTALRRWPGAAVVISPILPKTSVGAFRSLEPSTVAKASRAIAGDLLRAVRTREPMRTADAVLVASEGERGVVRAWFGRGDGEVVRHGLDIARWPMRSGSPERASALGRFGLDAGSSMLVACVARLEPLKNQLTLIRAIKRVPGAALVLVGPDGVASYGAKVRAAASERPGRVATTGALPSAEVASLLAHVDVHVLPSYRETVGLVTLEAAAVGCEVVASRDGWIREYLGETAFYADAASPGGIARAIRDAVARPRQPAARATVEAFGWERAARTLAEVYGRVTSSPRPGARR